MFLTRVQQLRIIQAALNRELDQDENHFAQALGLRRTYNEGTWNGRYLGI